MISEFFQYVSRELITPELVGLVLTTIASIIGAFLIRVVRNLSEWVKTRLNADQLSVLLRVTSTAVLAAEKALAGEAGETKKRAATEFVRSTLEGMGIQVTEEQISAAIEAAVKEIIDPVSTPTFTIGYQNGGASDEEIEEIVTEHAKRALRVL